MTVPPRAFQSKILTKAKSEEGFAMYRAALDWSVIEPIVIESRDDLKSEVRWKGRFDPFQHQVDNLMTFCRRLPVTLLADDVGLGKTISAGLIASELIARNRVTRMLIVAPKILGFQWKEELETKFDIPAVVVTGRDLLTAEPGDVGAVITTYQTARSYLERLPEDRFEMLVLDEAHKLRNLFGVAPPPQVAKVFHRALEQRRFRYVLMLTATPIQNRLWDLYSLVDLLAVARGHENPFGSEGMFARQFIEDSRDKARVLKPESREAFRKIVYSYMSRVRRGDANLEFPERKIELHRVKPSEQELALIRAVAKPIQKLNPLSQVSILQALVSSPHALMAQLSTMAANDTVPKELAARVCAIVADLRSTAKLEGLSQVVAHLQRENPDGWRMVVFTTRRETQTSIQNHLETLQLKVGVINGSSGLQNQGTLRRFRADPPEIHAIVSTEAGSEGINLQVANVLINFDLPWNPMIVEQRIGRVQRLGSRHRHVVIYNVMLEGTFEEHIVGRLMTKLQMATDAIGDIESLLEASGVGAEGDDGTSIEQKIRELIVASLAGIDTEAAAEKIGQSIEAGKRTLQAEKDNIDATLGSMHGYEYVGPRAPTLSPPQRSMAFEPFLRAAFASLGAAISEISLGVWCVAMGDRRQEYVRLHGDVDPLYASASLYAPDSPAFLRLVDKLLASGLHNIADHAPQAQLAAGRLVQAWAQRFGAERIRSNVVSARRRFAGTATVRARATTAHDSYERLLEIACDPDEHASTFSAEGAEDLPDVLENLSAVGINVERLAAVAQRDPDITEFRRFYLERRAQEVSTSGNDARKKQKLEDEFTPRVDATVVALLGVVEQDLTMQVRYQIDGADYSSELKVSPDRGRIDREPELAVCEVSNLLAPIDCLASCDITGKRALKHRLARSEASGRLALPGHVVRCDISKQMLLSDEVGVSDVSRANVSRRLLKQCAISGKWSEPTHRDLCAFTGADVLKAHLVESAVSGKLYRDDEMLHCVVSGRAGHKSEFILCYETRAPVVASLAERCAVTGHVVRPGVLQICESTKQRVLPRELERSSISGKLFLRSALVESSVSAARFLPLEGIRCAFGKYCTPGEAKRCAWSGRLSHPDDVRKCSLLDVPMDVEFLSDDGERLRILEQLLNGTNHATDCRDLWNMIGAKVADAADLKKFTVRSAMLSDDGKTLAFCAEFKTMAGLRTRYIGALYQIDHKRLVGRLRVCKRNAKANSGLRIV